jgi:hypothetical protein
MKILLITLTAVDAALMSYDLIWIALILATLLS